MRGRLIQWLLRSTVPCRVGLHMPVTSLVWDEVLDTPVDAGFHCAACQKEL